MIKTITLSLMMVSLSLSLSAQATTEWEWEQYGLSFVTQSDFKITNNTDTLFEADNKDIFLSIEVLDWDKASGSDVEAILANFVKEMKMTDIEYGELELSSLEGAYVDGVAERVNITLALLLDTESNVALISTVTYVDGQEQESADIINSFEMSE